MKQLRMLSLLVMAVSPFVSTSAAHASIQISVSYTAIDTVVSPRQTVFTTTHTIHYELEGHSVKMQSDLNAENHSALGQASMAQKTNGTGFTFKSSVSAHRLVLQEIYGAEIVTTVIQTDGSSSCTATRSSALRQGHQFREGRMTSTGEHFLSSDRSYENVTCMISN